MDFFIAHLTIKKMKKDILGGESVEVFIVKENLASVKNFYVVNGAFHLLFFKFVNRVNLLELASKFNDTSF